MAREQAVIRCVCVCMHTGAAAVLVPGYSYRRPTVRCDGCRAACIYNIRYRLFLHLIKVLFNAMSGIPAPFIFYHTHFEEIYVNFLYSNLYNSGCTGIFRANCSGKNCPRKSVAFVTSGNVNTCHQTTVDTPSRDRTRL